MRRLWALANKRYNQLTDKFIVWDEVAVSLESRSLGANDPSNI